VLAVFLRNSVWERLLTPKGKPNLSFTQPKLYDFFTPEDRSLFLSCKRALSPTVLQSLEDEAGGAPYQLDLLIMRQVFGPDRQQKYAHLTQVSRSKWPGKPVPLIVGPITADSVALGETKVVGIQYVNAGNASTCKP
jgi:hypothetical protein